MEKVDYKVERVAVFTCLFCGSRNEFVFYDEVKPTGTIHACDCCNRKVEIGNEVK